MADLEKVTQVQLNNALTETGSQLQRRLPPEEFQALGILLERTARRYPNQDLQQTMGEYLHDYERLALRYSLPKIEDAVAKLRIDPEQQFFPTPDEVAHEIEKERLKKVPSHIYARG